MAAARAFTHPDPSLDEQLLDETFLGSHCNPDSQFAQFGLNRHEACAGWWPSRVIDDVVVGFRCACSCHDSETDAENNGN